MPAPEPAAKHEESAAPPAAAQAETKITLPPGASQPPAPFEGEGWESMFDGQSLAGWRETRLRVMGKSTASPA